jgi:hypothetical protein
MAAGMEMTAFHQDLNRWILKVAGCPWNKVEVQWGKASRSVEAERLEKGVNLAQLFAGETPFEKRFSDLLQKVAARQKLHIQAMKARSPSAAEQHAMSAADLQKAEQQMGRLDKEIARAVQPVSHVLTFKQAKE